MENFEEKFLEELTKARARLEGKEAYDDEAIAKEFDPEVKYEKTDDTKPEEKAQPKEEKAPEKQPVAEVKKEEPAAPAKAAAGEKKKPNSEKLAVIWGGASVAIAFILSCVEMLVDSKAYAWQAAKAYLPFIGIVLGASAVIFGAVLIKKGKKGAVPLALGMLAILVAVILTSF